MKYLPLILLLILHLGHVSAADSMAASEKPSAIAEQIESTAKSYLLQQTQNLNGNVRIDIRPFSPNAIFEQCDALQAALPPGAKAWGNTNLEIRCVSPRSWSLYIRAHVSVVGPYTVAKNNISVGHVISEDDLSEAEGDLTSLSPSILIHADQVVGAIARTPIVAGQTIRTQFIKFNPPVNAGQIVKVISKGAAFQVSNQGRAMNTAQFGEFAQVRLQNGQTISGVAKSNGVVEVMQ